MKIKFFIKVFENHSLHAAWLVGHDIIELSIEWRFCALESV